MEVEGGFATLRRRGAAEAGAVFVVLDLLDGRLALLAPGHSNEEGERRFVRAHAAEWSDSATISDRLARELSRDPDIWIVDVERRDGEHRLDVVASY